MNAGVKAYLSEFLRVIGLVAIVGPIAAFAVAYARTGRAIGFGDALNISWSKVIGLVVICGVVAALPSRKSKA